MMHPYFKRYTVEEVQAWCSKGGKKKVPKGFAKNLELASISGKKGGSTSRKTAKKVEKKP